MPDDSVALKPNPKDDTMFFKYLKWIIINGLFLAVAVLGLHYQNPYAQNFLMFAIWAVTVLTVIVAFNDEMVERSRSRKHVNRKLDAIYDTVFIALLATYGWFFYASLYTVHFMTHQYIYWGENELNVEEPVEEE